MESVYITTDSNSGITPGYAKEHGIGVIAMPFTVNGRVYHENEDLAPQELEKMIEQEAEVSTSQAEPQGLAELWGRALEKYDRVVHIPMSSGLSGSCSTAFALAQEYGGRVSVVDNRRVSVTQKQSVLEANAMARAGKTAEEICAMLDRMAAQSRIYLSVETLTYLKRGGRITPAAAGLATVLSIRPVLLIAGGKLEKFDAPRGTRRARKLLMDAIEKDRDTMFEGQKTVIRAAYSTYDASVQDWIRELTVRFPEHSVFVDRLPANVTCHVGPGACGLTVSAVPEETGEVDF